MLQVVAVLGMFTIILATIRWFKQDTAEMMKIYAESTKAQIEAIKTEMKDFHGRLCAIEERHRETYEQEEYVVPKVGEEEILALLRKYPVPN